MDAPISKFIFVDLFFQDVISEDPITFMFSMWMIRLCLVCGWLGHLKDTRKDTSMATVYLTTEVSIIENRCVSETFKLEIKDAIEASSDKGLEKLLWSSDEKIGLNDQDLKASRRH